MNKHTRWLNGEINRWLEERVISPEQAETLRNRYRDHSSAVPWGLLVFASAGAIVVGLGVILLIAYNWDDIPKAGKLALVFVALIAAHVTGIRLLRRDGWQPKLGEALVLLGTMIFGAGIWLVAQVYNIDEHYPNGFLFWALGALGMAWAIRSTAHGLVAVVLLVIWGGCETFGFRDPEYASILLLVFGVMTLAWRLKSVLLLSAALIGIQFLFAVNVGIWGSSAYAFTFSLALGALLVAAARLLEPKTPAFSDGPAALAFFGQGAFIVCGYLLTFEHSAEHLLNWNYNPGFQPTKAMVFGWTLFAGGIAGWVMLAWQAVQRRNLEVRREEWLIPIALLYCYGMAASGAQGWGGFIAWSFDLILLGIAAMWIWRGCQESRLLPTVVGSLLLSAVVLARYLDLFESLASRGVAFIVLGAIFIAEAMYYRKVRRASGGTP
jgi:uncharacterized membrane protein